MQYRPCQFPVSTHRIKKQARSCSFSSFDVLHSSVLEGAGSEPSCCSYRNYMCERLSQKTWVLERCAGFLYSTAGCSLHTQRQVLPEKLEDSGNDIVLICKCIESKVKVRGQCDSWPRNILEHSSRHRVKTAQFFSILKNTGAYKRKKQNFRIKQ